MQPNNILDNLSTHLKQTIAQAIALATSLGESRVQPVHLLLSLTQQKGCLGFEMARKAKLTPDLIEGYLNTSEPKKKPLKSGDTALFPALSAVSRKVLEKSMVIAYEHSIPYVGTEHLLYGLVEIQDKTTAAIFKDNHISTDAIRNSVITVMQNLNRFPQAEDIEEMMEEMQDQDDRPTSQSRGTQPQKRKRKQSTAIESFAIKLTDEKFQKNIDPVVGRSEEIDRLIQILCRRSKNNPVLIGEPGVGKTAIVEGLAKRIVEGDVPEAMKYKDIYALDLTMMISGTIYRGEFESRIQAVVEEVSQKPNVILFIDELHNIVGAGSNQGTMDAANMLKPALARGKLHCIGATTLDEYQKYIAKDPALERRFQSLQVDEPSRDEAIEIMNGVKKYYESFHGIAIPSAVIPYIVDLSMDYIHDNFLPDKAIDLLDESAARMHVSLPLSKEKKLAQEITQKLERITEIKERAIEQEQFEEAQEAKDIEDELLTVQKQLEEETPPKVKRSELKKLTKEIVAHTLSGRIGVAAEELLQNKWEQLDTLEERLNKTIFGQEQAVSGVVQSLRHAAIGHKNRGPFASFLFVGPSGVGKTELAKELATHLYHSEAALLKFDMSEFAEGHSVSKFLGSPAGYVGHSERNLFTEKLKKQPHSLILFDEIDKAHPDVIKLLLQILDEGRLTDSKGKQIRFDQATIVLTSNVGEEFFKSIGIGFGNENKKELQTSSITKKLQEVFGKALMGRVGKVCIFNQLSEPAIAEIINRSIKQLSRSLKDKHGVALRIHKATLAKLAKKAYNTDSGARFVNQQLTHLLDEELLRILRLTRKQSSYTVQYDKEQVKLK